MYIPTAVSEREVEVLRRYARNKIVVEAGALLGFSTIQLARVADRVISIDRHTGYNHWRNDTFRQFMRNIWVAGVHQRVDVVVGDIVLMRHFPAGFVFIDLDGTCETTLTAITLAKATGTTYIGVHDYQRGACKGVQKAVELSKCPVVERVDSLVILLNPLRGIRGSN